MGCIFKQTIANRYYARASLLLGFMVYLAASYAFTRRCGGHVGKRLGGAAMKETTSALGATARVIEIVRSGASRY